MKNNVTVISNVRDCLIELIHNDSDPAMWIVRHWTKLMWFKKRISSHWFNDRQQATIFANLMKKDCTGH
jgi:hypothetical protein